MHARGLFCILVGLPKQVRAAALCADGIERCSIRRRALLRAREMAESDDGGLFAVSLTALASRRANPPPLLAEVSGLINLTSAQQLAAALDAAAHPSLQQPLEAVCAALNSQGAHASLETALLSASVPLDHAPAFSIAAMLRLLRQLPEPAFTCDLYKDVLDAGVNSLAPLLRKRLPPPHAALLDALGTAIGNVLCRTGIVDGAQPTADAEHERALRALVFALAPALLRPEPDANGIPPAERAAAERATRHWLRYHAQRQQFRKTGGAAAATEEQTQQPEPEKIVDRPSSPVKATSPTRGGGPGSLPSPSMSLPSPSSSARARGGALAMKSVSTAIASMFAREFGEVDGARKSVGTPTEVT